MKVLNTQNLKVEMEKLKRQRLGTTLKRIRRETTPVQRILYQIQHDNATMREQFSAVNNTPAKSHVYES